MKVQEPEYRSTRAEHDPLRGRRALISGGSPGVVRAVAAMLSEGGAEVIVLGEGPEGIDEMLADLPSGPGRARGVVADPFEPSAVERAFATADREFGAIDLLVNVAGSYDGAPTDAWRYRLHADLDAFIDCTHHALERLRHAGRGHIVNVGSMSPVSHAADLALFASARAALRAYTVTLHRELSLSGIKVSLIEPGPVGHGSSQMPAIPAPPPGECRLEDAGGMLRPEDIAAAVHYCLTQPTRCTVGLIQLGPLVAS